VLLNFDTRHGEARSLHALNRRGEGLIEVRGLANELRPGNSLTTQNAGVITPSFVQLVGVLVGHVRQRQDQREFVFRAMAPSVRAAVGSAFACLIASVWPHG
jgi:hypothetical protein